MSPFYIFFVLPLSLSLSVSWRSIVHSCFFMHLHMFGKTRSKVSYRKNVVLTNLDEEALHSFSIDTWDDNHRSFFLKHKFMYMNLAILFSHIFWISCSVQHKFIIKSYKKLCYSSYFKVYFKFAKPSGIAIK